MALIMHARNSNRWFTFSKPGEWDSSLRLFEPNRRCFGTRHPRKGYVRGVTLGRCRRRRQTSLKGRAEWQWNWDFMRREWDSNPRYAVNVYLFSRQAPSATRPPLHNLKSSRAPHGDPYAYCTPERGLSLVNDSILVRMRSKLPTRNSGTLLYNGRHG